MSTRIVLCRPLIGHTSLEDSPVVGKKYRIILLLGIALLCVTREAFFAATARDTKQVGVVPLI